MEWTGDLYTKAILAESLKHPRFDEGALSLVHGANERFTLNLQDPHNYSKDHTAIERFDSVFSQQDHQLTTCVLYYNKGQGHLEELYVSDHQLPWKDYYKIHLQYCFSPYSPKSLDWVVAEDSSVKF
ncbi:uncharacterized protein CTRU02_212488 [Colletotrichum truncatum]|uniref:Uncharacterized protein n=2 Tax=Colletotrichum truncatum TaxID=5467 RepID=A0ACC3YNP2_COLTU|nr:uncharacterized protein CTRU02_13536 [Colletotrichum truncatum]XP_036584628.1 uncharacterized protein CTRU02_05703 [Colletotrichum truncatum]KAF6783300.1 hypothetical protein CTRU02_13536 [Colletotrichum truncatum]KAF6794146.1 hypothetical protein CTRU02_05703 [Colletotrichum truncatum]